MPPVPASSVPPRIVSDAPLSDPSGRPRPSSGLREYVIRDPVSDERLGAITATDEGACRDAVARAASAQPAWARTQARERAAVLRRWAASLRWDADEQARLLTRETGALPRDARAQVLAGVEAIERFSAVDPRHHERRPVGDDDHEEAIERVPRGVVAVLLPWRDPVALACAQIAACLISGNTVVVKPSGRAPFSVERAVRRLRAPADVVGLIHGGAETGACLASDLDVGIVLHTGSVESGRSVASACAKRLSAAVTERGEKGAVVVDRHVHPEAAAAFASVAAFSHAGQLCGAVDRLIVHRAVLGPFTTALLKRMAQLGYGSGDDPSATLPPLIDARQRATVHGQVTAAVAEGAQVLTGGQLPHGPGCFYPATLLDRVRPTMAVWSQKTYGPVAALLSFEELGDALDDAADNGLRAATTVLTADTTNATRAAREFDVDAIDPGAVAGGASTLAAERLRRPGTGLGYGEELLDELTRWRVVRRDA